MATFSRLLFLISLCSSLVAAVPTTGNLHPFFRRDTSAADIVAAIMPTSTSCSGALYPDQCYTNVQAAPFLIEAMTRYGITNAAEIAAVLALTAYESGELKYRHSEFPVVAGKGTSNMQSPTYNQEYASSIPALASGITAANGDPDAILALVTVDDYNFASGAWFLTSQCSSIRSQLQANTDDGFAAYIGCIGTTMNDDRLAYWHSAQTAFGI
ncbi:hypothetical protein SEUCBS139899_004965 [Sporothrix eucalyptigena]|uniref:Uncharacterized protein n=1 Tax=Sporothrix eucalyptigena TaxID=1812306 RepID=A0ABP0AL52_9PEZI